MPNVWPPTLPAPLQGQMGESVQDIMLSAANDAGRDRRRRKFTDPVEYIDCRIQVNQAQRTTFKSFFKTDCKGGAESFTWSHPEEGDVQAFFIGGYQIDHLAGRRYTISFRLEILP